MNDSITESGAPDDRTVTHLRPNMDGEQSAREGDSARLDAARSSVRRTLRSIEVLERLLAKDAGDPGRGGDPRFRAAPRHVARLIWLLGFPDAANAESDAIAPAIARARRAADALAEWVAEMQAGLIPSRVVRVAEFGNENWVEPGDRLLAFACETATVALQELRFDLDAAVPDRASCAA